MRYHDFINGAKTKLLIKYVEVMSEKTDGVSPSSKKKWSKNPNVKHRRRGALERLEHTLANPNPNHKEKDIKRMKREVAILKERI